MHLKKQKKSRQKRNKGKKSAIRNLPGALMKSGRKKGQLQNQLNNMHGSFCLGITAGEFGVGIIVHVSARSRERSAQGWKS